MYMWCEIEAEQYWIMPEISVITAAAAAWPYALHIQITLNNTNVGETCYSQNELTIH